MELADLFNLRVGIEASTSVYLTSGVGGTNRTQEHVSVNLTKVKPCKYFHVPLWNDRSGFVPGMLVFAVTVEVARVEWAVMVIV